MNINQSVRYLFTALCAATAVGTASLAQATVNADTQKAATMTGAAGVTEVSFSKETTNLSNDARDEIKSLVLNAEKRGEIKEVRVAAWSDEEYPAKGAKLSKTETKLAEKRAEEIQNYLKTNLNVSTVHTYNMARRPSGLQAFFKTKGAETKDTLESSGAAPTSSDQTGLFGMKGKVSEALVMVYLK